MKNKIGLISGFLFGSVGFLCMFKIIFLNHTSPEDELAPGIVVIIAIAAGIIFACLGNWIQNFLREKSTRV